MKLKQHPDDFQVEERSEVTTTGQGPFALYRLEKRGWSTPDALAAVRRRWKIELRRLSYGGLKDRHAHTVQYLTIFHGPRRGLHHHGVTVEYLGQVVAPYTARDIRANAFRLTVRDLSRAALTHAQQALEEVRADGVPNYFDDQRFGSVGQGGEYIGRLLVQGRFEDALRQALVAPYEHDRAAQKQEKAILRRLWGDWSACKAQLPRGHARSLVDYLVTHPSDFRGAVARLRPELRGLYLSAYQSALWNRILSHVLRQCCRPEQLVYVRTPRDEVIMMRGLDESQRRELGSLLLPLPSARLKLAPTDPWATIIHGVLAEDGLELGQLRVKGIRELFFSKGERQALVIPDGLQCEADADEDHPGKQRLTLSFELPRGSYATLIVKRLFASEQATSSD
jgi:tRNA pseudouridine13 synthase